jgi:hypothetical protein
MKPADTAGAAAYGNGTPCGNGDPGLADAVADGASSRRSGAFMQPGVEQPALPFQHRP